MAGNDVNKELLEILRCPACESRPRVEPRGDKLVCVECGRAYPVRDGIPVMLIEEAEIAEEKK